MTKRLNIMLALLALALCLTPLAALASAIQTMNDVWRLCVNSGDVFLPRKRF